MKSTFLYILIFFYFSGNVSADPYKLIALHEAEGKYPIGMKAEVLQFPDLQGEDPLSFEQVSSPAFDSLFYPNHGSFIIFKDGQSHHWVRFKVKNKSGDSEQKWLLESDQWYAAIEMYVVYQDGRVSRKKADATEQEVDDTHVVLKLNVPAQQEATVYLNLTGGKHFLTIWEEAAFFKYARMRDMLYSAFLAVFLIMILYNLFLFFSIKDVSYLWYSLYCAGFILLQNTLTGFGAHFLWPAYPWVNGFHMELLALTNFFGFLAARSFLDLSRLPFWFRRLLNISLVACGVLMAGTFFQLPLISSLVLIVFSAFMSVLLFVTAFIVWQRGYTPARFYLAAWTFLLLSVVVYTLSIVGWIPVSFFTIHVVKVCSVIEVVLLSLGLADRINVSKREEKKAQEKVIAVLQEKENIAESSNKALERKAGELEEAYHALLESQGESVRLQELDQVKTRFFANISHEFRTPLTLILGQTEHFLKEMKADQKSRKEHELIYRNANRLLQLINQLLDLAKLEADGLRLQAEKIDVKNYLNIYVASFASLAEDKKLRLHFSPEEPVPEAYLDKDKFEKVIGNLLSNAFKFTPEGGEVRVNLSLSAGKEEARDSCSGFLKIEVRDTGRGISKEKLDRIFDRFYQEESSFTSTVNGTGIGLALVKELVNAMHGQVFVESEPGKGTCFTILLPPGKAHLKEEEIIMPAEPVEESLRLNFPEQLLVAEEELSGSPEIIPGDFEKPVLLVAEDNADVRFFIRTLFAAQYTVLEAKDGHQGLSLATEHVPDMIISDLMMPGMDGFKLCEKLKTDPRTSHIPVILLTARANSECRIEGLETGADDYVVKPFKAHELQARVNNLTEGRRRLRKLFSKEIFVRPKEIAVNSVDEQFLQQINQVLEENLENAGFTTENLASEMNMSRSQLHRKLSALVNQSATEFMRRFRLQRAGQLLLANNGHVADIAYRTGFNNLSYFSKCFRELYGKTPSEYCEKGNAAKSSSIKSDKAPAEAESNLF